MRIIVNGEARETAAPTLEALVAEVVGEGRAVATAVNGAFAPRGQRGEIRLGEGDEVEILTPMQGG